MGIEIEVNTLEDMCALMCDNRIPEKKDQKDGEKEKGERRRINAGHSQTPY